MRIPRTLLPVTWMLCAMAVHAQSPTSDAFVEATLWQERAETAGAPLLSPDAYQRGIAGIEKARRDAAAGRDAERIQRQLDEARERLASSLEQAQRARASFADVLEAREAAQQADAFRFAADRWVKAEQLFNDAARRLEKGAQDDARERGAEAEAAYRDAQLQSIRTQYLAETWRLLAEAQEARADRYAPRTLANAQALLARAERELAANLERPEAAGEAIAMATSEARHALELARVGDSVRRGDRTLEDVLLSLESGIVAMAEAAGLSADLGEPHAALTAGLAREFRDLRTRADANARDLADRDRQIAGLEDEIRDLTEQLGGTVAQRDKLVMTLEAQARVREQFDQLARQFAPEEATVLRDGDSVIIRLIGLNFATGSARLRPSSAPLLGKLEQAVTVFPSASIVVEGHTDSSGSEQANQRLSEERARTVTRFLIDEGGLSAQRIQSIGYGAARPVANNATAEGRAQNRRIDVVVRPNLDDPAY